MRTTSWLIEKQIAGCLVLLLAAPVARAKPSPGQDTVASQGAEESPPTNAQQSSSAPGTATPSPGLGAPAFRDTPAPGADAGQSSDQNAPVNTAQAGSADSQIGSAGSQASPTQEQSSPAKPVGTAAAPAVKTTGVAGSRVSGAAIAPAKQRRVRIFLIRVAVVVGACVAVGTVVALSHASPSQPR